MDVPFQQAKMIFFNGLAISNGTMVVCNVPVALFSAKSSVCSCMLRWRGTYSASSSSPPRSCLSIRFGYVACPIMTYSLIFSVMLTILAVIKRKHKSEDFMFVEELFNGLELRYLSGDVRPAEAARLIQ